MFVFVGAVGHPHFVRIRRHIEENPTILRLRGTQSADDSEPAGYAIAVVAFFVNVAFGIFDFEERNGNVGTTAVGNRQMNQEEVAFRESGSRETV